MSPEDKVKRNKKFGKAILFLADKGFICAGNWLFEKDGIVYDLSAADLSQIDRIEKEGLFIVKRA